MKQSLQQRTPDAPAKSLSSRIHDLVGGFRGKVASIGLVALGAFAALSGCNTPTPRHARARMDAATPITALANTDSHTAVDAAEDHEINDAPQAHLPEVAPTPATAPSEAVASTPINASNVFGSHSVLMHGVATHDASIESGITGALIVGLTNDGDQALTSSDLHQAQHLAAVLNTHAVRARHAATSAPQHTHYVARDNVTHRPNPAHSDQMTVHKTEINSTTYYAVVALDSANGNELWRTGWINPMGNEHPTADRLTRHTHRSGVAARTARPNVATARPAPTPVAPVAVTPTPTAPTQPMTPQVIAEAPRAGVVDAPRAAVDDFVNRMNLDRAVNEWVRFSAENVNGRTSLRMTVLNAPNLHRSVRNQTLVVPLEVEILANGSRRLIVARTGTIAATSIQETALRFANLHNRRGRVSEDGLGRAYLDYSDTSITTEDAVRDASDSLYAQGTGFGVTRLRSWASNGLESDLIVSNRPTTPHGLTQDEILTMSTTPSNQRVINAPAVPLAADLYEGSHVRNGMPINDAIHNALLALVRVRLHPANEVRNETLFPRTLGSTPMRVQVDHAFERGTDTVVTHISAAAFYAGQSALQNVTLPAPTPHVEGVAVPAPAPDATPHAKTGNYPLLESQEDTLSYLDPDSAAYRDTIAQLDTHAEAVRRAERDEFMTFLDDFDTASKRANAARVHNASNGSGAETRYMDPAVAAVLLDQPNDTISNLAIPVLTTPAITPVMAERFVDTDTAREMLARVDAHRSTSAKIRGHVRSIFGAVRSFFGGNQLA